MEKLFVCCPDRFHHRTVLQVVQRYVLSNAIKRYTQETLLQRVFHGVSMVKRYQYGQKWVLVGQRLNGPPGEVSQHVSASFFEPTDDLTASSSGSS
jgi:hypothetical protein